MSAATESAPRQAQERDLVRRAARAVLVTAVRGRKARGGDWGEAVLAEFAETRGGWEAVRWVAGGLRAVWHERRRRARELPRPLRISRRIAVIAVVALVAAVLVNQFVMNVAMMSSGSMEPTLLIGDRYLQDKAAWRLTGLHRGDVVVYNAPNPRIKRVIGLPGDTIECRDGKVWRNGRQLDEPYLGTDPDESRTDCATTTVPEGSLYLLGDHRLVSQDSRQSGPVRENAIRARIVHEIWPVRR
jgi:signal peptidase I